MPKFLRIYVPWELTVHGLRGGHSGSEIDKQYANAIECCARILYHFSNDSNFMISDINGGSKRNVIPSHCSAFVWIPKDNEAHLTHTVEQILSELKTEYSVSDPAISFGCNRRRVCREKLLLSTKARFSHERCTSRLTE
jgi:dipeptidase D